MRVIDLPPVWLVFCLVLAWNLSWQVPWGPAFWPGAVLLVVAAAITLAALVEFSRARTTVIPRQAPSALIVSGIYRVTRNPIYLADILVLLGISLILGSLTGFLLVLPLAVLLERRFIRGEEARLRAVFGEEFEAYARATRRWL